MSERRETTVPPVEILYEDRHLLIVNKPPGIDVHGRGPGDGESLVARVAAQLGLDPRRLHPASRLDRPVSGVVPLARSKIGRRSLTQQYQHRQVHRRYVAIVSGVPFPDRGVWDRPIGRHPRDPRRRVIDGQEAKPAVTAYSVAPSLDGAFALVTLKPRTGRTHQLRVHLGQVARCPVLGDRRYGGPDAVTLADGAVLAVERVMLHAAQISLSHPEGSPADPRLLVKAPLWSDFRAILEQLGLGSDLDGGAPSTLPPAISGR